jgi:hypothetical protein
MIIGVVGGSSCNKEIYDLAFEVGVEIARNKKILICGGLTGVMEAVCKGVKNGKGLTIGILPGELKGEANQWIDIPIVTGMSVARNIIIVRSSDSIIAIDGKYGTLSEIAIALNLGVPVVGLKTWNLDESIKIANTPKEAVKLAIKLGKK